MKKFFIIFVFILFTITLKQLNACQHEFDASTQLIDGEQIMPGDTVCLLGGNWGYIQIRNLHGTEDNPIIIHNKNGSVKIQTDWFYAIKLNNCSHIKLSGAGEDSYFYGIKVLSVANDHGAGLTIDAMSTNIEVEFLEISNTGIAGIYAKTEPDFLGDCSFPAVREKFTMYNTSIHDCYLHDIGDEGLYIGSSKYTGQTVYHCNDTIVLPHVLSGVKVFNNILEDIGWDGIQVGSAVEDCQIYNNVVIRDSQAEEEFQMSGIIIGGGSDCDCYNNKIMDGKGDGIDFLGLKGVEIYNNLIVNPGKDYQTSTPPNEQQKHGIWIGQLETENNQTLYIYNNTIVSPRTFGIKLANTDFISNDIKNNIIVDPGAYELFGEDSYINLFYPGIPLDEQDNFKRPDTAQAQFVDPLNANFDLHYYALSVNSGYDMNFMDLHDDYLGRPRPFDTEYDIGALECQDSTLFSVDRVPSPEIYHFVSPNPARFNTDLVLYSSQKNRIRIEIYHNTGRLKETLFNGFTNKGLNRFNISLYTYSSGLYFYKIIREGSINTGKFVKR